jgi:hypothetical protein
MSSIGHLAKPSRADRESGKSRGVCQVCHGLIFEVATGIWTDDADGHNQETYWRHAKTPR